MPTLTHESAAVDHVLQHARLIVAQNYVHVVDPQVPERNRDLAAQLGLLIEAATAVASAIADNSYEGAAMPHATVNQLAREAEQITVQIRSSLCSNAVHR